jgi:AraC family transcriptional regulator
MQDNMGERFSLGAGFGLSNAPLIVTRPVRDAELSVAHLMCPVASGSTQAVSLPAQDCFFMMLYLEDTHHCDVAVDGGETPVRLYRKGAVCIVDLAQGASIRLHSPLHALGFLIPRPLLAEISEFSRAPEAKTLRCRRGEHDDVIWNMGKALLPLFDQQPSQRSCLVGHLAVAICAHLLHVHGDGSDSKARGAGLSVWQEKAAKDFMAHHFVQRLELGMIAKAADFPEAGFALAFERTTGKTPQQWLTDYRITQAKRYLTGHDHTLEQIASLCGFATLASFQDEFAAITGFSVERWRNRWLN